MKLMAFNYVTNHKEMFRLFLQLRIQFILFLKLKESDPNTIKYY